MSYCSLCSPWFNSFLEASGFLKTPQKATQSVNEQASAQALLINHMLNQVTYVLKCLILKKKLYSVQTTQA